MEREFRACDTSDMKVMTTFFPPVVLDGSRNRYGLLVQYTEQSTTRDEGMSYYDFSDIDQIIHVFSEQENGLVYCNVSKKRSTFIP